MDNNEKLFTSEERELFEKYNKLKEVYKGYSKLTFEYCKQFMINNETLKNNGEPYLTYDQWYHTIKEKEYSDYLEKEEWKAHKQLIESVNREQDEFEILLRDTCGKFCFNLYSNLLNLNIENQYLARFVYLCTYMDYDNKIHYGKTNNGLAVESDLQEILNLKKDTFGDTKKVFISNKLIIINEDKTITINRKYALKGKINNDKLKKGGTRMFEYGIKDIYENAKGTSEHKRIGMLIKLLPCVNYDWNVLCCNPEEKKDSEVVPLTMKDICRVVGYTENQSSRLKKELLKMKIGGKSVFVMHTLNDREAFSINPKLYYKGDNINAIRFLVALFNMMDK